MEGTAKLITPNTMQFERLVDASVATVWQAIGKETGLQGWFIPTVRFEPKLGGTFFFMEGWEGTISLYKEERVISFFPAAGGETTFECMAAGPQTRFMLTDRTAPGFVPPPDIPMAADAPRPDGLYQPGGPGTPWVGILVGWHHFADDLAAFVQGEKVPSAARPPLGPLHDFYKERLATYFR